MKLIQMIYILAQQFVTRDIWGLYTAMSDYYLSRFFQDVKAPGWPDMHNFAQFVLTAPDHITKECHDQHGLQTYLHDLGSVDYFRRTDRHLSLGYKKQDLVFVPVLKCASTFFADLFLHQLIGWQPINLYDQDWSRIKPFGLLMEPSTRRINGIMQVLQGLYSVADLERLVNTDRALGQILSLIPWLDSHSMPYTIMYGNLLSKINWIPMEIGQENWVYEINKILVDDQITYPCKSVNQTPKNIVELRKKLAEIMMSPPNNEFQGAISFAEDFQFYSNLLVKFTQNLLLKSQ